MDIGLSVEVSDNAGKLSAVAFTLSAPISTERQRIHSSPETGLVAAITVAAALLAVVLSNAAPTGSTIVDALYRAAFAGIVTIASTRAKRPTVLVGALLTTAFAGGPIAAATAAAAVGIGLLLFLHRRDRSVRAAAGAAVGVGALMLNWPNVSLVSAAIAALAVVPILASGLPRLRRRARLGLWIALGVMALLTLAAVGGVIIFGLNSATTISRGVNTARAAVDGLGTAEPEETAAKFAQAASDFNTVAVDSAAWWLAPARAVPVIAPHLRLAQNAATSGADLGTVAADVAVQVTDDQLRTQDGGIDLVRLAALAEPADTATLSLRKAQRRLDAARSPWIVGPIRDQIRLIDQQVAEARNTSELAALAARRAPALLGAGGERRYLFLLGNPAEARDIGGHIGNWAEVVVNNGSIGVRRVGQPYDLFGPGTSPRPTLAPGAYPVSLEEMSPNLFPQNWGGSPDLPTVARLAADLWPQVNGGQKLDGVAYADPIAFAALLSITGPVTIPANGFQLTADNAVDFLTKQQFAVLRQTGGGGDPLGEAIRNALSDFTSQQLPTPERIASTFGTVVSQGHLQFASIHADDMPLLDRTGLLGSVERPGAGDLLAVINRNANPSKIDAYLHRSTLYNVSWNPTTGETRADLSVKLRNSAPTAGLPEVVDAGPAGTPRGTNRTQLCILSPLSVRSASIDGEKAGIGTQPELRGVQRHCMFVDVPAGSERTASFNLIGTLGAGVPYELQWVGQPLLNPQDAKITVAADNSTVDGSKRSVTRTVRSDEDVFFKVRPDVLVPPPST